MGVIVVVCAAFGLTVSEAKTEMICLRAKVMPESTATFSVEAMGQVYNHTNEFVHLGGNVNHNADLSIEVNRRIHNAWCSFRKYALEMYDRPSAPLELKLRMLRAEVFETTLYGCVTWSPRACGITFEDDLEQLNGDSVRSDSLSVRQRADSVCQLLHRGLDS